MKFFIVESAYAVSNFFFRYPTPGSLSYLWNFGVSSLGFLFIQIISGIFLSMHYIPSEESAFLSVEEIMRNISNGWFFRYVHSNGASFFFICVYIHVFRSIYYLTFVKPKQWVWYTGSIILILMIATAFTGYVLPWGQMSFWAATVITNLFSVIPFCGEEVVVWLWGDFGVSSSTLNRFYTIHFILPFIILALAALHIFILHKFGSSSKSGIIEKNDKTMFQPFYTFKDINFLIIVFIIFLAVVGFAPNYLSHPDNYIPADPLVTPAHIVPEWYFLPFYAMLRCVPDKSLGVLVLLASLLQLFLLPTIYPHRDTINSKLINLRGNLIAFSFINFWRYVEENQLTRLSISFRFYTFFFWLFLINCIFLGILGAKPLESPYIGVSMLCTFFYFLFFYLGAFIFSEYSFSFVAYCHLLYIRTDDLCLRIKGKLIIFYYKLKHTDDMSPGLKTLKYALHRTFTWFYRKREKRLEREWEAEQEKKWQEEQEKKKEEEK